MSKKFLSLILMCSMVLLFSQKTAKAAPENEKVSLSREQLQNITNLYPDFEKHKHNELSYKVSDSPLQLKIAKSVHIEESILKDGTERTIIYFDANYTNPKIDTKIYTPYAYLLPFSTIPTPEGSTRIVVEKGSLSSNKYFDGKTNKTKSQLLSIFFSKSSDFASGKVFGASQPVFNLFSSLIQSGFNTGEYSWADSYAYSRQRRVIKYSQVYDGVNWGTYIQSSQLETYWLTEVVPYNSSGNPLPSKYVYYYPTNNYKPIEWWPSRNFNNNSELLRQASYRYLSNLGVYYDPFGNPQTSSDWKGTGAFTY